MRRTRFVGFTLLEVVASIAVLGLAAATLVTLQGEIGEFASPQKAAISNQRGVLLAEACAERVLKTRELLSGPLSGVQDANVCDFLEASFSPYTVAVAVTRLAAETSVTGTCAPPTIPLCPRFCSGSTRSGPACAQFNITVTHGTTNQSLDPVWFLMVER